MAGGLFVYGLCAHRSAWRLRSRHYGRSVPAAHGSRPLERNARGALSFLYRSALLRDGTPSSPRSRAHGRSVPAACRSQLLPKHGERGFFFFCCLRNFALSCRTPIRHRHSCFFYLVLKSQCVTYFGLKPHRYADLQYLHLEYSNLAH